MFPFPIKWKQYQIYLCNGFHNLQNLILMVAQTINYSDIADKQVGLGIAVLITGVIAGIILQFTRKIRSMPAYFVSSFQFFKNKSPKLPIVATIFYYILLATPIILLIVWVILLGVNVGTNPALVVLFIAIFIGLIFIPSYSKLFYFKVLGMFLAYIAAEMLALGLVFSAQNPTSFWCLTALSLTLNCIFVIICLWIVDGRSWSIPTNIPSSLKQKVRSQIKIWKQQESPPEIIDGGFFHKVSNYSIGLRGFAIFLAYLISLIVLAVYSVVGRYQTIYNFQALVNSIAVVTTDLIGFMLIVISRKAGFDTNLGSLVAISVRACIIAFSGQFWFFGYCLLYLILVFYISILIINKYYPTFQKPPTAQIKRSNILKMPEASFLALLLIFSGLVYFMGNDNEKRLPVSEAQIGEGRYPFWAVGVSTILLSFSMFFYLVTLRIVDRSRMKIRSPNIYFIGCQGCSEYYVFLFLSYAFLIVLGFHLWSIVRQHLIWTSCVFLPLFYECFSIFYLNWTQNDYLLLGDVGQFNKKLKKRKQRQEKIASMRNSVILKLKEQSKENQQAIMAEQMNMRTMDNAKIQENWVLDNHDINEEYEEWREKANFFQALKTGKLLPTDKRIVISLPIMLVVLIAYSLTFFYTQDRSMSAFTVSVELLVLFLLFVPAKRYFSTFLALNAAQIVSFILGILLNYSFGILSYVFDWNKSPAYTVLWTVVNPLLVFTYSAISLLRDKGLIVPTIVVCIISMVFSFGPGIILLAWFRSIAVGIALIGAGFYYSYFLTTVIIYKKMNNSVPFVLYIITVIIIILTCFAVMIYGFIDENFDNFYGFTITYLVINLLVLLYSIYRVASDIFQRFEKPNFYSPYGSPVYKYDFNIRSVVQNPLPIKLWLGSWFMFYIYTILMKIFIVDTNYGTAASMIPLIVFSMSFFYVVTYNANQAGQIGEEISDEILQTSWKQVIEIKEKNLGDFIHLDELQKQLEELKKKEQSGEKTVRAKGIKIAPKQNDKPKQDKPKENENVDKNKESEMNQTTTKLDVKKEEEEGDIDISYYIYDLETKINKAEENEKILLANFWTIVMFKTESKRRTKMLQFINFIKDSSQILASAGIALVLNDSLYDLQLIYNHSFNELQTLSPLQRVFFNKQLKAYVERKQNQQKEQQQVNKKEVQNNNKREKQLQNKILNDKKKDIQDPNLPLQKMKDGPTKLKKLKETLKGPYEDEQFKPVTDYIPSAIRNMIKGWKRPSKLSAAFIDDINTNMQVRQGMLGDCYLISAIGVLGKQKLKEIITDPSLCPPGAYMVKFNKFGRQLYVIVDDQFPVVNPNSQNAWGFGRCQDDKELYCNIIEKAYAKLYGGYDKIQGGKTSFTLGQLTGGFPQQIQLKPFQERNTNEIFQRIVQFKKSGYLMGAGSPPNPRGDSALIDGIFQGHAYLVLDARDLDGNKLVKLRNPHGNRSKQSTQDWSDDSPKWTSRLKGLLGQQFAEDGAFWMGIQDFVYSYRALYVCRIFDNSWKRIGPFTGEWKGESAAGLRSDSGPVLLAKNPQYGIRVTKACTIFIQLNQNQISNGSGKNQIFFMVQRNQGKRIDTPSTNKLVGMSGPAINAKTISKQISLTADAFPYTFSIMLATFFAKSEGSYNLTMYCNDQNVEIIDNSVFGR